MVHARNGKPDWNRFRDFQVEESEEPAEKRCVAAEQFMVWMEHLCQEVEKKQDLILIRQGQLLLLHKFFEWQKALDPSHRHGSGKKRHVCVFEIFERGYDRLTLHQLCLEPLLVEHPPVPPPPPAPPQLRLAGMTWGEVIEQEE